MKRSELKEKALFLAGFSQIHLVEPHTSMKSLLKEIEDGDVTIRDMALLKRASIMKAFAELFIIHNERTLEIFKRDHQEFIDHALGDDLDAIQEAISILRDHRSKKSA